MYLAQAFVVAYLLSMPLMAVFIESIGGHNVARIAEVGIGLVCAFALVANANSDRRSFGVLPDALVLGLVLSLAFLSALNAPDRFMAMRELASFAGLAAVMIVVSKARHSALVFSGVVTVASAAYIAVLLVIIVATYWAGRGLIREELFVGYDNYRFFNHVQTAALPLAVLAVTIAPPRTRIRWVAWFAAIVGFALLFTIAGRGTMVGIVVAAAAVAVAFGRVSYSLLRNLAVAAALGLVGFVLLFYALPLLMAATSGLSEGHYGARLWSGQGRLFLWHLAQSYIEGAPWLGIGPMHYAHYPNGMASHPHNIYLQVAAEWGVPMLLLVAVIGVLMLRGLMVSVRNCSEKGERDVGIGLFLACVAIAVDGMFSGNFVMPVSQVWIAFTFGWTLAWLNGRSRYKRASCSRNGRRISPQRLAILGLLVSQIWLVWNIWPEVRHLDEYVQKNMDRVPTAVMNPRFWSHGWF